MSVIHLTLASVVSRRPRSGRLLPAWGVVGAAVAMLMSWSGAATSAATTHRPEVPTARVGRDSLASAASVGLDLTRPGQLAEAAHQLLSNDPATWHEAQLRLANAGPRALDAIEAAGALKTPIGRQRSTQTISMGLCLTLTRKQVRAHRAADALTRAAFDRATFVVDSLIDSLRFPLCPHCPAGLGLISRQVEEVSGPVGGFGIDEALALLRRSSPADRAYAATLLGQWEALTVADSLVPACSDRSRLEMRLDDYGVNKTVGDFAQSALDALREQARPPRRFDALAGPADLVGRLQSPAKTWDEWWSAARPRYRKWWALVEAGDANSIPLFDAFRASLDDLLIRRVESPDGSTRVTLLGPPGTRCTVQADSVHVEHARVPFVITVTGPDSALVAARDTARANEALRPPRFMFTPGRIFSVEGAAQFPHDPPRSFVLGVRTGFNWTVRVFPMGTWSLDTTGVAR